MCKVKDINECEKRVFINTRDGKYFYSEWFYDDCRKSEYTNSTEQELQEKISLQEIFHIAEKDIEAWSINRNKEKDVVYISDHAFLRMKERNGWNKKTALRMTKKIFDNGKRVHNIKGQERKYIMSRMSKHPDDEYVVYGQNLYIFRANILVTVFPMSKMERTEKRERHAA